MKGLEATWMAGGEGGHTEEVIIVSDPIRNESFVKEGCTPEEEITVIVMRIKQKGPFFCVQLSQLVVEYELSETGTRMDMGLIE